jgi:hypothetical protein
VCGDIALDMRGIEASDWYQRSDELVSDGAVRLFYVKSQEHGRVWDAQ